VSGVGFVTVTSHDPPVQVTARMWQDRPTIDAGYGGWNEIARPHRPPITTWGSPPGLRMTLPLVLDGWRAGATVEGQVSQLERLGRPTASDGRPPRLTVRSPGSAIPHQDRTWIVSDLQWGDALMNDDGNRVRQQVTLLLLEYVEDEYLVERSAANRARKKAAPKRKAGAPAKRVVAKRRTVRIAHKAATFATTVTAGQFGLGEDLLAIAARELGDADRWHEIADLNGLRDPRSITPGQVIRLP
jgi:hypothetical protein